MSEVIDAPSAPAIAQELALQTVTTQVAEFNAIEAGLAELANRYQGVAFDVSTTKGMEEAKQARMAIRDVRYKAQNLLTATKKPLNEIKAQVDALANRIIARIEAIEEPIDAQIKAEEKRKADEKAAREAAEAEAREQVQKRIDAIRDYLVRAAGATCQELAEMGRELEALDISIELYGDRTGEALQVRSQVMGELVVISAGKAELLLREAAIAQQERELAERRAAFEAEQAAARAAQAEREATEAAERTQRRMAEERERERQARIQEHLDDMHRDYGNLPMGTSSERIVMLMSDLGGMALTAEIFGERLQEAEGIKAGLLQGLDIALGHAKQTEAEQARQAAERQAREDQERAAAERLAKVQAAADDLLAALHQLVYQSSDGTWHAGIQADSDVTDIVGPVMNKVYGEK